MRAKTLLCWIPRVSAVVALLITAWGSFVVLSKPVTHWFAVSAAIWMALQLGSILWLLRGSFAALAAAALTTAIVGRLFSTVALEAGHPRRRIGRLRSPSASPERSRDTG